MTTNLFFNADLVAKLQLPDLVPKLQFGNAPPRSSASVAHTAKRSLANARSQTGVWERVEFGNEWSLGTSGVWEGVDTTGVWERVENAQAQAPPAAAACCWAMIAAAAAEPLLPWIDASDGRPKPNPANGFDQSCSPVAVSRQYV